MIEKITDPSTSMRRTQYVRPGYDCVDQPCGKRGCGTPRGASHGVHGDEWVYGVSDGDVALVLTVYSCKPPRCEPRPADGLSFHVHTTFPMELEWLRGEPSYDTDHCEFLNGKPCLGDEPRYCAARDFFAEHGVDSYEQPASFWLALETLFAERAAEARAKRVDRTHRRCSCCAGRGIVEASAGPTEAQRQAFWRIFRAIAPTAEVPAEVQPQLDTLISFLCDRLEPAKDPA